MCAINTGKYISIQLLVYSPYSDEITSDFPRIRIVFSFNPVYSMEQPFKSGEIFHVFWCTRWNTILKFDSLVYSMQ